MIQAGDREHRRNDEIMKIPGVMARLMNAVAFIDNILELYITERGLLD